MFNEWSQRTGADHSLEGLLREMDDNDVERALVLGHWVLQEGRRDGPFASRPNNDLIDLVSGRGDRLRALLGVNITRDGPMDLDLLDEFLNRPEFAGVKFFTGYETFHANDPRCEPVFEILEKHDAVAMFHTGDTLLPSGHVQYANPIAVDEVAVAHPRLRLVLAHAGQHWMPDAGEVVGKNPNVWADISGWFVGRDDLPPHVEFLKHQFRELVYWGTGCDRLMFGSDWPLMRIRPYIRFVQSCSDFLSNDELRAILYDNAKRLYWK